MQSVESFCFRFILHLLSLVKPVIQIIVSIDKDPGMTNMLVEENQEQEKNVEQPVNEQEETDGGQGGENGTRARG